MLTLENLIRILTIEDLDRIHNFDLKNTVHRRRGDI